MTSHLTKSSPSLQTRLVIYFIIAALVPIIIIAILALQNIKTNLESEVIEKNELLARQLSDHIEQFLNEPKAVLQQVNLITKKNPLIRQEDINQYLETLISNYKLFEMIKILDNNGIVTFVAPFDENICGLDMSHKTYFKKVLETKNVFWSETFISPQTGNISLILCVPIDNGLVIGNINLAGLSDITNKIRIGKHGYAALTDVTGVIIAHPDKNLVLERLNVKNLKPVAKGLSGSEGTYQYTFGGEDKIASVRIIPSIGWLSFMSQSKDEAFSPITKMFRLIYSSTLIGLFIAIIIALVSLKQILKPLDRLTNDAMRISKGDLSFEGEVSFKEINTLTMSIKTMIKSIKNRETKLFNEISERKKTQSELQYFQNYLSNIIDSMPSVLIGVDNKGVVTQWNNTAEANTGITAEKAYGKYLPDIFPQMIPEIDQIKESIHTSEIIKDLKKPRSSKNRQIYEDITIYPLTANGVDGAVIRIDDVTDKVQMEDIMIQSEKMMSVGGLAAGMAHEINNPLAGIMQNIQVVKNRLSSNSPKNLESAKEFDIDFGSMIKFMTHRKIFLMLDMIHESGNRASNIVKNMLSFSRKSEHSSKLNDIRNVLDNTLDLVSNDYNLKKKYDFKKIEIAKDYEDNLPNIRCEYTKLQQVFLNIFKNGAEAMAKVEKENPQFKISIKYINNKIQLEIVDNGHGMSEEVRSRIFEPFFTTKQVGEGTGLGLSISYFIITEDHGGEMSVETKENEGTKFIIKLPVGTYAKK